VHQGVARVGLYHHRAFRSHLRQGPDAESRQGIGAHNAQRGLGTMVAPHSPVPADLARGLQSAVLSPWRQQAQHNQGNGNSNSSRIVW